MTNHTEPKSTTDLGQQYVIDQLIPEGLTILSGPAKSRKSILCQQLCLEVSLGTKALGQFDVVAGSAIYVTTDDIEANWLQRLEKMERYHGAEQRSPTNLYMMFDPPFGRWKQYDICDWLNDMKQNIPDLRLVVIDPFRPAYLSEYQEKADKTFSELGRIAKEEHMAVVLVRLEAKSGPAVTTDGFDAVISQKTDQDSIMGEITVKTRSRYSLAFDPQTLINTAEAVVL